MRSNRQRDSSKRPHIDVRQLRARSQNTALSQSQQFQWLLSMVEFDPTDTELIKIVEESLAEAEYQAMIEPDPFRPTNPALPTFLPGNLIVGAVVSSGVPYLIYDDMLKTHMLICGRTGGGKSNLILLLLSQILWKKNNAQDI